MRIALDLYEVGEGMMRARLSRERPDAEDAEIDAAILAWLQHRPGAEFGDFPVPHRPPPGSGDAA